MKSFTITKANRVANSPFTIQGTDMVFDITHEHPIPVETQTFDEKGNPITIRFIMGCKELNKEKQVKDGWPEKRKPTAQERAMLTFLGGMLTVPDGYAHCERYLMLAPWFAGEPGKEKTRPPGSRVIYELYDQDAIDEENVNFEVLVADARQAILKGSKNQLISLLRLSRPGSVIDQNINVKQARLQLLEVANKNPDFILKGIKTATTDITVIVSKAIDYGILNIDTMNKLKMQSVSDPAKYDNVANITDVGGRNQKIERVVAYFEGNEGATTFSEVKRKVSEKDASLGLDEQEVKEPSDDNTPTTTTTTTPEEE